MGDILQAYAAYAQCDDLRMNSSSGGLFSLFAYYILSMKGVVYGVRMSENCLSAEYTRVVDEDALSCLRGSKYMQAEMGNTYILAKNDLDSGVPVLFTGTGCQINGLKKFLDKEYPNLYAIDVVCHGVPSQALWGKYVDYVEKQNGAKLTGVNFRCKDNSWSAFGVKTTDANQKKVYISKDKDPFMQMFLRNLCLRPSCYECLAKQHKMSDITIADFWGISDIIPDLDDGKGISLVLIRTAKGKEIYRTISKSLVSFEVDYEQAIRRNSAEYKSVGKPEGRDCFFADMNTLTFEQLRKKYALPVKEPMVKRLKKTIKGILMKTPAKMLWGGVNTNKSLQYGLLFSFRKSK